MICQHGHGVACLACDDERDALRAEVERVTRERNEARDFASRVCHRTAHAASVTLALACIDCQRERAGRAEAEVERLRTLVPTDDECAAMREAARAISEAFYAHGEAAETLRALADRVEAARGGGR